MIIELEKIKEILPHRYPMLLIDRVLEMEAGQYCKAVRNLSGSDPVFLGHFPGNPIYPGVLTIEAMAQTGGVAAYYGLNEPKNTNIFFGGIDNARFKKPVLPGDQMVLEARLVSKRLNMWIFEGTASVNDTIMAQAKIKMMIFVSDE